jgi:hypothetical protein
MPSLKRGIRKAGARLVLTARQESPFRLVKLFDRGGRWLLAKLTVIGSYNFALKGMLSADGIQIRPH